MLSEQSLFADTKQPSDSKIFVSNTIEDQTKIENCNGSDICAGVIKSFVPENHLRSHPGLKFSLNVSSLIQIMKSHISEKDSSSARTEVSNLVQSVDESTYVIVILMSSWEKVMILAIIISITSILVIWQAASHSHASGFEQTLPSINFQRCPNCTATKSKCTHCFAYGSEDHRKSVCPHKD